MEQNLLFISFPKKTRNIFSGTAAVSQRQKLISRTYLIYRQLNSNFHKVLGLEGKF